MTPNTQDKAADKAGTPGIQNHLYQEVILEHNRKPRNFKVLEDAKHYALGKNPLCGDQFAVYVKLDEAGKIEDIGFQGAGCAIAKASASMMTQQVKGKTPEEASEMIQAFQGMVRGEHEAEAEATESCLGRLTLFKGVQQYPVRVKCATLAWHTLQAALKGDTPEVTTE